MIQCIRMGLAMVLLSRLILPTVSAQEISVDSSIKSGYAWRGKTVSDVPVFQPRISFTGSYLYAEVWGNMELADDNNQAFEFNDVQYTLGLEKQWGRVFFSSGLIHYTHPGLETPDTSEVYLGMTTTTRFSPTVIIYRDIDEIKGTYIQFSISHWFPLPWRNTDGLELYLMAGYGNDSYKEGHFKGNMEDNGSGQGPGMGHGDGPMSAPSLSSGLADYGIGLELPIRLGRGMIRFSLLYTNLADSDMHSPRFPEDDSRLVAGITYTLRFPLNR